MYKKLGAHYIQQIKFCSNINSGKFNGNSWLYNKHIQHHVMQPQTGLAKMKFKKIQTKPFGILVCKNCTFYSTHTYNSNGVRVTVLTARPTTLIDTTCVVTSIVGGEE